VKLLNIRASDTTDIWRPRCRHGLGRSTGSLWRGQVLWTIKIVWYRSP